MFYLKLTFDMIPQLLNKILLSTVLLFSMLRLDAQGSLLSAQVIPPTQFLIDENTGQVLGCEFIHLIGKDAAAVKGFKKKASSKEIGALEQSLFKLIQKRGDVLFLLNLPTDKFYVCVDVSEGGFLHGIFFFNSKRTLITKYYFDKLQILDVDFNSAETFIKIAGPFSGDFFFFTFEGKLVRSGNFNKITGDRTTSYGRIDIGENGDIWFLDNHYCYIFDKEGQIVDKIPGGLTNSFIDESEKNIFFTNYDKRLLIYNIGEKRITHISSTAFARIAIKNKIIYIEYKGKKYEYSIN